VVIAMVVIPVTVAMIPAAMVRSVVAVIPSGVTVVHGLRIGRARLYIYRCRRAK
jgi:hypothetical protein